MSDKPTMIIGRVVSMEAGRPTISVPIGRSLAEQELITAARAWRNETNQQRRDKAFERMLAAAEKV